MSCTTIEDWRSAVEEMTLDQLRASLGFTQTQLSETLGMTQAAVSKLEFRNDSYISSIRKFVEAIGGRLEINAVFPDSRRVKVRGLDGDEILGEVRALLRQNCKITPLDPATGRFNNSFRLTRIDDDGRQIYLEKDNGDCIEIPTRRITEVLPGPTNGKPTIVINGRVKWFEDILRWRFVP
jgi:transcriptional regulator with XRE-family HTH domain